MDILRLKKNIWLFVIILGLSHTAESSDKVRELPFPGETHSAMTVQRTFSGILSLNDHLLLFPDRQQFLVKMPFNENGKTRSEKFGKITDQLRIPILGSTYPGDWRGGFVNEKSLLVWDASILQLLVLKLPDFQPVQSITVPADTLKPAADQQGEPTTIETNKTREEFRRVGKKIFGSKYTGITEIPVTWEKHPGRKFLISSRVPGFPLTMMTCEKDDDAACVLKRRCFLEDAPKSSPEDVIGIGVYGPAKEVLMGNRALNQIEVFKFKSCFDVVWRRSLKLPSKLSKLTNLHVDRAGRLWVSTDSPDPYNDANLYYWDLESWK